MCKFSPPTGLYQADHKLHIVCPSTFNLFTWPKAITHRPQASVQRTTASPAFSNSTHFTCWTFFQHTELNIKLREKKIKKRFVISHLAGNNRSRWLTSQPASQPASRRWKFSLKYMTVYVTYKQYPLEYKTNFLKNSATCKYPDVGAPL